MSSTATRSVAPAITPAISTATSRLRANPRLSSASYALFSADMYVVIALVTDQTASTRPTAASTRLVEP